MVWSSSGGAPGIGGPQEACPDDPAGGSVPEVPLHAIRDIWANFQGQNHSALDFIF